MFIRLLFTHRRQSPDCIHFTFSCVISCLSCFQTAGNIIVVGQWQLCCCSHLHYWCVCGSFISFLPPYLLPSFWHYNPSHTHAHKLTFLCYVVMKPGILFCLNQKPFFSLLYSFLFLGHCRTAAENNSVLSLLNLFAHVLRIISVILTQVILTKVTHIGHSCVSLQNVEIFTPQFWKP